jgi:hypothetical protein
MFVRFCFMLSLEESYLTIYSEFTRREIFKEALIIADNYTTELRKRSKSKNVMIDKKQMN